MGWIAFFDCCNYILILSGTHFPQFFWQRFLFLLIQNTYPIINDSILSKFPCLTGNSKCGKAFQIERENVWL